MLQLRIFLSNSISPNGIVEYAVDFERFGLDLKGRELELYYVDKAGELKLLTKCTVNYGR